MIETKKYLDYAGLQQFWASVKTYYAGTVAKADSALQDFEVKYNGSAEQIVSIDANKKVSVDLSAYTKKSDLVAVLKFMGVKENKSELPNDGTAKVGNIWHVIYDDSVTPKRMINAEFVCSAEKTATEATKWEEMGSIIDLSNYYTKAETDLKITEEIAKLDATVSQTAGADGLALQVVEVDGKLTSVTGSIAVNTYDSYGSASSALASAKTYTDNSVATEATLREAADGVEAENRKAGDADVYNAILSIEDYKIKQMFIENKVVAATATEVKNAINNMTGNEVVVTLTSSVALDERLSVAAGKTAIINLNGKTLTAPTGDRAVNVAPGGYAAISGGTVASSQNAYNIVVRGKGTMGDYGSTLILDGVKMTNSDADKLLLATNGSDSDVDIVLNNCEFEGLMYLPAMGKVTINGGKFSVANKPILYVKNGCPIELNNVEFEMTVDNTYSTNWAHFENGSVDSPAALVVEACNYGLKGNPSVYIRDGKFSVINNGFNGEVFDILQINYNGNNPVVFECNKPYWKTSNVTGHVTVDGTTAPTDGWLVFTSAEGQGMATVERVNG